MKNEIKLKPVFLADSLTEQSPFADVQKAVGQLKILHTGLALPGQGRH